MSKPIVEPRDLEHVVGVLACTDTIFLPLPDPAIDPHTLATVRACVTNYGTVWGAIGTAEDRAAWRCQCLRLAESGVYRVRFSIDHHVYIQLFDATEHEIRRLLRGERGLLDSADLLRVAAADFGEWVPESELPGDSPLGTCWHALPLLRRGLLESRFAGDGAEYRATDAALLSTFGEGLDGVEPDIDAACVDRVADLRTAYEMHAKVKRFDLRTMAVPTTSTEG